MFFKTDRLILRPFGERDLPYLQRYAVREDFWRYLPLNPQTPESIAGFLEKRLEDHWGEGSYHCAIELASAGHVIGSVRVTARDPANRSGDLGYALDSAFRGMGYMTEAVRALMEVGFTELGLHRIWATADVENAPSWRVMERVGMTREGLMRQHSLIRDCWRDSYLYAKLASDQG